MVAKKILITGGAGQIAYQLAFRIASGELLGSSSPIELILLEKPEFLGALAGVLMELQDCSYPLLHNTVITDDPEVAFKDIDIAFLVGSKPRGPGQQRKDLLVENGIIFKEQGQYLDYLAKDSVKVLVVGNPCNTNCWIAYKSCQRLKASNFQAMTRLDENRVRGLLANKLGVSVLDLKNISVWGNHSTTLVPDLSHAFCDGKPLYSLLDKSWIEENFCKQVQERGAEIIKIRGKSSAASAAQAALDAMKSWLGLSNSQWFSSVIYSKNNSFGLDDDLMFSFPLYTKQNQVLVQDLKIKDEWILNKIKLSEVELKEERDMVFNLFK